MSDGNIKSKKNGIFILLGAVLFVLVIIVESVEVYPAQPVESKIASFLLLILSLVLVLSGIFNRQGISKYFMSAIRIITATLLVILCLIFLHELLLRISNSYLVMNWESGRNVKSTDLGSFTKNATREEIDWLSEYLLERRILDRNLGMFMLYGASHAKEGDHREMRLVRIVADDRRYPEDIRKAALVCLAMACENDKEYMQVLRHVAGRNDDAAAKAARAYLKRLEADIDGQNSNREVWNQNTN